MPQLRHHLSSSRASFLRSNRTNKTTRSLSRALSLRDSFLLGDVNDLPLGFVLFFLFLLFHHLPKPAYKFVCYNRMAGWLALSWPSETGRKTSGESGTSYGEWLHKRSHSHFAFQTKKRIPSLTAFRPYGLHPNPSLLFNYRWYCDVGAVVVYPIDSGGSLNILSNVNRFFFPVCI